MNFTDCPNCGAYRRNCYCTYEEMEKAYQILRRREKERRRALGKKTVIEEEAGKFRRGVEVGLSFND